MIRFRNRGIFLITTLFVSIFLVMMLVGITTLVQGNLAATGSYYNREVARQAALAGLSYMQARLETSSYAFAPPPDGVAGGAANCASPDMSISEQGYNVVGLITNQALALNGETQIRMLFRVSFNQSYFKYKPDTANQPTLSNVVLPPAEYVSMNNLNRMHTTSAYSYHNGLPYQQIPGGTCNLIIEGMAVRDDGYVAARRVLETTLTLGQMGTLAAGASAGHDMNYTLEHPNMVLKVTGQGGLAALDNINLTGQDAVQSGTMPDYQFSTKASLPSMSSNSFTYTVAGSVYNFTSQVAQANKIPPPAIDPSTLPPVRPGASDVQAGTWVIWNGQLYHYPVDYQTKDTSGNFIPIQQQPWAQPDPTKPPTYNGVATDTPNGQKALDGNGGKLTLNPIDNSITISSNDVNVQYSGNGKGNGSGYSSGALAVVVAPNQFTDSKGNVLGTISSPTVNSNAVGSVQMTFSPGPTETTPQLRASGSITIMGNVLGNGTVVTTGTAPNGSTVPGDITMVGKSSLDPRSDNGVALYAAGDCNVQELANVQPPNSVSAVGTAFTAASLVAGNGGATNNAAMTQQQALFSALAQGMSQNPFPVATNFSVQPVPYYGVFKDPTGAIGAFGADFATASMQVMFNPVSVAYNGQTYSGPLCQVLADLSANAPPGSQWPMDPWTMGNYMKNLVTQNDWSNTSFSGGNTFAWISATGIADYETSGVGPGSSNNNGPSPSPSSSSTTTSSSSSTTALNQTFAGLLYAQRNVNIQNHCGKFKADGAIAAYGGNPSQPPGTNGGDINITANGIVFDLDSSRLGSFASFFGGEVVLTRQSLCTY